MDDLTVAYGVLLHRRELRDTLRGEPEGSPAGSVAIGRSHSLAQLIYRLPGLLEQSAWWPAKQRSPAAPGPAHDTQTLSGGESRHLELAR
jgi:hypothetical protein